MFEGIGGRYHREKPENLQSLSAGFPKSGGVNILLSFRAKAGIQFF
jgi:hypothetical protein